jgi:hypothetical protein
VLRGSGAEVDSLRKRIAVVHSEGGGVEVDGLRKGSAVARSDAGVEAVACSGAGNEAAACSGVKIEDGRWQRWRVHFWGDSRVRENTGPKI